MHMVRIFVKNVLNEDMRFSPDPEEAHYLMSVIRMREGEELVVVDGKGMVFNASIKECGKKGCVIELSGTVKESHEMQARITLYQSVSKGERMDLTIQKSVELGVYRIVPVISERCVVRLDGKKDKSERWQKIALEAARQSGRDIVPVVTEPVPFAEAVRSASDSIKVIPWEEASGVDLKDVIGGRRPAGISVFIGPEGGYTPSEADMARAAGIVPVTLGSRILRTETAGPAVLAMINYELEM